MDSDDQQHAPIARTRSHRCPCRVLVADDHAPGLELAAEALRRFDCDVQTATDGHAAVETIRVQTFDLVFLDVHMPRMGGLAAADAIRALERESGRKRTPIIALTASAMAHEQRECITHGFDEVLLKPFRLETLRRMLHKWCPA